MSVPEEGGETVSGRRLDSRLDTASVPERLLRRVVDWVPFVIPARVSSPLFFGGATAALAAGWILLDGTLTALRTLDE